MAQQKKIIVKGTVIDKGDKNDGTLPSVSILSGDPLKPIGMTDGNGNFSVSVDENATLVFKYIGYVTHKVEVKGRTKITISLNPDNNQLKEVSIAGYVSKTKETSVGSSIIISGKELQDVPVANITDLLQGKVAGLNIQQNTGSPGIRGSIAIRGLSNLTISGSGNEAFLTPTTPLFVVDGIPVDDNSSYQYGFQQAGPGISPISLIPQEDIANMEVLKDASATSLYGSRGAYGVILITTKRGNSKIPVIRYSGKFFVSAVPKLRSVIGGKGERLLRIDQIMTSDSSYYHALGLVNGTEFLSDSLNAYYNNSTDWQSYFYKTTYNQTHNLDISGGDQTFNYKANLGYFDQSGIQQNTGFNRYNLNMNMQYQPNSKFKLYAGINNSLGKQQKGSGNGLINNGVAEGGASSSLLPAPSQFTSVNSVLSAIQTDNDNKTVNVNSTVELQYEFVKGLRLTSNFNYTYNTATEDNFLPAAINNNVPSLFTYNSVKNTVYNRNLLAYVYSIKDKSGEDAHNFNAYVFTEINSANYKADAIKSNKGVNDHIRGPIIGVDNYVTSLGGTLNDFYQSRSVALAGNFSYNYKQKYVLDLSYRFDGNSTNGPDAGYTKSPSVGVRWNFNKEEFLSKLNWLEYGSLRLSYGSNIVPNGTIYDVYGKYVSGNLYNGKPTVNLDTARLPNTNLQPTKNTTLNAGFDLALFNNRISLTFDTYYKQVDNIFRTKDLSNTNSFKSVTTNEASMVNYGYEANVTARPLPSSSKVNWTISANIAINHDVLTHLPDGVRQFIYVDATTGQSILYRVGLNSLSNFIYNTKGVYSTIGDVPVDPLTGLRYRIGGNGVLNYFQAGDPRFTDLNGDYVLDNQDLVVAGNSQPQITGGISTFIQYKSFSFSAQGSFTLKRDILNNALASQFQIFNNPTAIDKNGNRILPQGLVPLSLYNYWLASGDNATYPNPYDFTRSKIVDPFRFAQTLFQEDGSYFKLNQVTLSYLINQKFTKRYGVNRLNVSLTASNVFMISNYSGPSAENVSALGRDSSGGYPNPRTYTFGLNVEF
ncbi:SusC/RagA family TonB-linked outer membrane protein [Pedobacter punctiformis]|uniref:SusC/RagA family TonB-linked outer membrane protein n=1 Tax=Pedobacter punctiformis TaxID=3004097 RepID=A0ABT4LDF1_9SPHI|nr:SusC/RagA family TonB-linked outer membrane protein [Pedobacter sp. HCMS5-2]MCZ4244859.1 SusC/RagA family TonB-linked outer membrane protein [Pedobacter sp. HCMS5-2]